MSTLINMTLITVITMTSDDCSAGEARLFSEVLYLAASRPWHQSCTKRSSLLSERTISPDSVRSALGSFRYNRHFSKEHPAVLVASIFLGVVSTQSMRLDSSSRRALTQHSCTRPCSNCILKIWLLQIIDAAAAGGGRVCFWIVYFAKCSIFL